MKIEKIIFFIILGLLSFTEYKSYGDLDNNNNKHSASTKINFDDPDLLRVPFYEFISDKPINFFGPPRLGEKSRILVVANVSPESIDKNFFHYTIRYSLIGSGGKVLESHDYSLKSSAKNIYGINEGEKANSFYLDPNIIPLPVQIIYLHSKNKKRAKYLRIFLVEKDPEIISVAVKFDLHKDLEPSLKESILFRISDPILRRLFKGNVYDYDNIRETEKDNLLENLWFGLGPKGLPGKDFNIIMLYDLTAASPAPWIEPFGLRVGPYEYGVVTVPENGGDLGLQLYQIPYDPESQQPFQIELLRHGRVDIDRQSYTVNSLNSDQILLKKMPGGVYEIHSNKPLVLGISYQQGDKLPIEMEPDKETLNVYGIPEAGQVEYDISHASSNTEPFRLDLRAMVSKDQLIEDQIGSKTFDFTAKYDLFDDSGNLIQSGPLPVKAKFSFYDWIQGIGERIRVTEPTSFFFDFPPNVSKILVSAGDSHLPILVNAYSHSSHFLRIMNVPEEFYMVLSDPQRQPGWFALYPKDHKKLLSQGLYTNLFMQRRPKPENPFFMQEDFMAHDLAPNSIAAAVRTLSPTHLNISPNIILPTEYHSLEPNKANAIKIYGTDSKSIIASEIIYVRDSSDLLKLEIYLDEKHIFSQSVTGNNGAIQLPLIPAGEHSIFIKSNSEAKFFSNWRIQPGPYFLLKTAFSISSEALEFAYEKTSDGIEGLFGIFYGPLQSKNPVEINITIKDKINRALKPFTAWTYQDWQFNLNLPQEGSSPVLGGAMSTLSDGLAFFIPIGDDLPIGKYTIEVRSPSATEGYLTLTRVILGLGKNVMYFTH